MREKLSLGTATIIASLSACNHRGPFYAIPLRTISSIARSTSLTRFGTRSSAPPPIPPELLLQQKTSQIGQEVIIMLFLSKTGEQTKQSRPARGRDAAASPVCTCVRTFPPHILP